MTICHDPILLIGYLLGGAESRVLHVLRLVIPSPFMIRIAYYCSGHGYGHATRVSAFASSLLSLAAKPHIYIISSAPTHVFSECISRGALYRHAYIDPIIVQPLAYRVDRQQSIEVLKKFMSEKEEKLAAEVAWLLSEHIDCVLSDAAFLACEAATNAGIPSILVTNFTFDSVYSYLGTEISDRALPATDFLRPSSATAAVMLNSEEEDMPVPAAILEPLVSQILAGYRHADILLLLPGFIPIPSFFQSIPLPALTWVDPLTNRFRPDIELSLLALPTDEPALHASIPFPACAYGAGSNNTSYSYAFRKKPLRSVKRAPLLSRPASPGIHTVEGRSKLLSSIGIPQDLHDPSRIKILVVSFGGQKIYKPHGGKSPSKSPSPLPESAAPPSRHIRSVSLPVDLHPTERKPDHCNDSSMPSHVTLNKLYIPGSPAPVSSPTSPLISNFPSKSPEVSIFEPNEVHSSHDNIDSRPLDDEPSLLPSSSWIAIICGVSSNWSVPGEEESSIPGFYAAPPDIYMPDLTAVADVLMGKLGYGTVSETVAQSTPFVYVPSPKDNTEVPRPLFVEEHGLRLFLEAEGIGVELSRDEYESGRWAGKVEEAYLKSKKRTRDPRDCRESTQDIANLAEWVVESVEEWKTQNNL